MSRNKKKTVMVGMSGGVDSSVAALLLKQKGYNVIGVFLKNWSPASLDLSDPQARKQWEAACPWEKDFADMRAVCEVLDIPYYILNFEKEYKEKVLSYFFAEYEKGRTPNPDIMCNKEVKFKVFLEHALHLEADFIATGHYARKEKIGKEWQTHVPKDIAKDQSYFLYTLGQKELARVLWPLSGMTKKQVRVMAEKYKLPTFNKPDSQGICFVGEVDVREFLMTKISRKPGDIITVEGEKVGTHQGLSFYTIGQREGLDIGGRAKPLYVVAKDISKNQLIVAEGNDHPALFSERLLFSEASWVSGSAPSFPFRCEARIRYRQPLQKVTIQPAKERSGFFEAHFKNSQRAIAPGQSIVFYGETQLLGGGVIDSKL